MSSFNNLVKRVESLNEAKTPQYVKAAAAGEHFAGVPGKLKSKGLSSSSLDAIKFIAQILSRLDIIDVLTHDAIITGKYTDDLL